MNETINDLLRRRAAETPEKDFLVFGEQQISYGELDHHADRMAARLIRRGVRPGENVAVLIGNRPEFLYAWFGILRAGAAMVPINTRLKTPEIEYIRDNSDSRLLLTIDDVQGHLKEQPVELPEVRPDDLAAVVYTSGTTGKPKGAMLTHANYVWDAEAIVRRAEMTAADRFLCILPLFHVNAQVVTTLAPMVAGGSMVLMERFSPLEMLAELARTGATAFSAVPTVYAVLNSIPEAERFDLSHLRFCICGAAPMPIEVFTTFEQKFNARILEGYGLTEGTCASSVNVLHKRKIGSIGVPLEGQEMRIEDGEIVIRGPNVMKGYYRNPAATAEVLRDGWLYTGDLGYEDDEGFFYIRGRKKEMIIRGGENIYPKEIEDVLYGHPAVAEAAVVGRPHPKWGEEVVAFIVHRGECTAESIIDFCRERLADFKCPTRVLFREELPKTATGKIQKHLLT